MRPSDFQNLLVSSLALLAKADGTIDPSEVDAVHVLLDDLITGVAERETARELLRARIIDAVEPLTAGKMTSGQQAFYVRAIERVMAADGVAHSAEAALAVRLFQNANLEPRQVLALSGKCYEYVYGSANGEIVDERPRQVPGIAIPDE